MTGETSGLPGGASAMTDLLGRAAGLRRRGGATGRAAAAVIETAAARLFDLFVGEHLGVVTTPARQRGGIASLRAV